MNEESKKFLKSTIDKFNSFYKALKEEEKEYFLECITNTSIIEDIPGYDLIYKGHKKFDSICVGDRILLKDLIKIGFNNIKYYYNDNNYVKGYCKSDFDEKDLQESVIIIDFYNDCDGFLCVEANKEELLKETKYFV